MGAGAIDPRIHRKAFELIASDGADRWEKFLADEESRPWAHFKEYLQETYNSSVGLRMVQELAEYQRTLNMSEPTIDATAPEQAAQPAEVTESIEEKVEVEVTAENGVKDGPDDVVMEDAPVAVNMASITDDQWPAMKALIEKALAHRDSE
jgi:hypothetical protein